MEQMKDFCNQGKIELKVVFLKFVNIFHSLPKKLFEKLVEFSLQILFLFF
jgi:hypothetical protein